MTVIDLGNGQTAQRHHLTKEVLSGLDQATAALSAAQASVRSWIRQLLPMQGAADISGEIICAAPGQSGRTYALGEIGGAILVDERDFAAFQLLGFTPVPSGSPPTSLRIGSVFEDTEIGGFVRWNGSSWSAVTLE